MKPPLLQTDWMNRVSFDPDRGHEHVEGFIFKLNDLEQQRALWVRLSLVGNRQQASGGVAAIWFDEESGGPIGANEQFPMSQVSIDPERAGLCIAEASAEEAFSQGTVRGEGYRIAWNISLDDELGPYTPLPHSGMYGCRLVPYKAVSPHPCATAHGWVEICTGSGAGARVNRVSIDGWRGMQGHSWGRRHLEPHAWTQCNAFDQGESATFFEAFAANTRAMGLSVRPVAGRLVYQGTTYRFDTWRNLWGGGASTIEPTRWTFAMSSPDGTLQGEVEGASKQTLAFKYDNPSGAASHSLNTKLARLRLRLQGSDGVEATLTSNKAALEVVQHETNHGIALMP